MKSEQKLTSLSFDPFPSFSILFCVKGEKGGKRKQKENGLFLMQGVDPEGILLKLHKHDLIHGRDNKVEYMKMTKIEGRVQ